MRLHCTDSVHQLNAPLFAGQDPRLVGYPEQQLECVAFPRTGLRHQKLPSRYPAHCCLPRILLKPAYTRGNAKRQQLEGYRCKGEATRHVQEASKYSEAPAMRLPKIRWGELSAFPCGSKAVMLALLLFYYCW